MPLNLLNFYIFRLLGLGLLTSALSGCVVFVPLIESDFKAEDRVVVAGVFEYENPELVPAALKQFDEYSEAQSFVAAHRTRPEPTRPTPEMIRNARLARLINKLSADTAVSRTHAASDIGVLGSSARSAINPLARVLATDENKWVRRAAAKSLGKIGTQNVIEPLTKACSDKDKWVAHSAKNALRMVKKKLGLPYSRPRLKMQSTGTEMYRFRGNTRESS